MIPTDTTRALAVIPSLSRAECMQAALRPGLDVRVRAALARRMRQLEREHMERRRLTGAPA